MIASGTLGTDGYGEGLDRGFPLDELDFLVLKTVTPHRKHGNEGETFRSERGYSLNAVGLRNPGVAALAGEILPRWRDAPVKVAASIAAVTPGELGDMARRISRTGIPQAIEINMGCPSAPGLDLLSAWDAGDVQEAVKAVRETTHLPVWVKVSPNLHSISMAVTAAQWGGAEAVTAGNTMPAVLDIPEDGSRPLMGGLSGDALLPINLRLAWEAARHGGIKVWGCGGIRHVRDARRYLAAGADGVQIGTAALNDPLVAVRIARKLGGGR